MKKIPKVEYQTPEQLAARIRERESEAELLPPGTARQSVLIEVAQLRAYADVKRWLASAAPESTATALASSSSMKKRLRLPKSSRGD